jgi:hypothetical protein
MIRVVLASVGLSFILTATGVSQVRIELPARQARTREELHATVNNPGRTPVTICLSLAVVGAKSSPSPFWLQVNQSSKWITQRTAPDIGPIFGAPFVLEAGKSQEFPVHVNLAGTLRLQLEYWRGSLPNLDCTTGSKPSKIVTSMPFSVVDSDVEEHIQYILSTLQGESSIRTALVHGARGSGVHQPWMDQMRQQDFERAVVWINIHYNRRGLAKTMQVNRIDYFRRYDSSVPISDLDASNAARVSGLEKLLSEGALRRAGNGFWLDVPRPRPNPFVGGVHVEFLDDEWLPTELVMYCAGPACVPASHEMQSPVK